MEAPSARCAPSRPTLAPLPLPAAPLPPQVDNATRGFQELGAEIVPLAGTLTLVADKAQGAGRGAGWTAVG